MTVTYSQRQENPLFVGTSLSLSRYGVMRKDAVWFLRFIEPDLFCILEPLGNIPYLKLFSAITSAPTLCPPPSHLSELGLMTWSNMSSHNSAFTGNLYNSW